MGACSCRASLAAHDQQEDNDAITGLARSFSSPPPHLRSRSVARSPLSSRAASRLAVSRAVSPANSAPVSLVQVQVKPSYSQLHPPRDQLAQDGSVSLGALLVDPGVDASPAGSLLPSLACTPDGGPGVHWRRIGGERRLHAQGHGQSHAKSLSLDSTRRASASSAAALAALAAAGLPGLTPAVGSGAVSATEGAIVFTSQSQAPPLRALGSQSATSSVSTRRGHRRPFSLDDWSAKCSGSHSTCRAPPPLHMSDEAYLEYVLSWKAARAAAEAEQRSLFFGSADGNSKHETHHPQPQPASPTVTSPDSDPPSPNNEATIEAERRKSVSQCGSNRPLSPDDSKPTLNNSQVQPLPSLLHFLRQLRVEPPSPTPTLPDSPFVPVVADDHSSVDRDAAASVTPGSATPITPLSWTGVQVFHGTPLSLTSRHLQNAQVPDLSPGASYSSIANTHRSPSRTASPARAAPSAAASATGPGPSTSLPRSASPVVSRQMLFARNRSLTGSSGGAFQRSSSSASPLPVHRTQTMHVRLHSQPQPAHVPFLPLVPDLSTSVSPQQA